MKFEFQMEREINFNYINNFFVTSLILIRSRFLFFLCGSRKWYNVTTIEDLNERS